VLQYFLYYVVAVLWPMRAPRLWPLYFAASLVAVALSARVWLAMGGNRLLQVPGWRRLGWASR
jgi:hypothetical protein